MKTADGTGFTKDYPGKYTLRLRYLIDENDPSAYSSITGRIGVDGDYPSTGSGRSVVKGSWHSYTQSFEIKDDGTISYGKTTTAFTKPITRFDLVNSYSQTASDVLYYIDDITMTYDPSRYVTLNYVDSNGKIIKSVDTLHYDNLGAKLVTAADLGLNNGVKFFTGVVTGLDGDQQKSEMFVVKPYVKIDGVYYYGSALEASYNEVYEAFNK